MTIGPGDIMRALVTLGIEERQRLRELVDKPKQETPPPEPELEPITKEMRLNGWTEETWTRYVADYERRTNRVPDNVVMPFVRPRAPIRLENVAMYNPLTRKLKK